MTNQITASANATANLAATQPVQGKVDARFSLSDLYAKWDALGDVPIGDDECIEEVFLDFEVGTHREEIWHWFERQHPLFVVGDVMQGIRHQDDGTFQLLQSYGYFAGARDPKVKPDFSGRFMVRDTEDDADGFCIVGDDLGALVSEALEHLEIAPARERGNLKEAAEESAPVLVSLDGGKTFLPATSGVRIIYMNVPVPGEDEVGELHLNATSEGMISDLWVSREEHLDHNLGTSSVLIDDLIQRLVEDPVLDHDDSPSPGL